MPVPDEPFKHHVGAVCDGLVDVHESVADGLGSSAHDEANHARGERSSQRCNRRGRGI